VDGDGIVRDYLARLEAAAWPLQPGRRAELADEVGEHIEAALVEAGRRDVATVRNVLERLGRPEEIVASEVESDAPPPTWSGVAPASTPRPSAWGPLEITSILLLTFGMFVVPFFGPILGLALAWASTRWTTREKLVATLLFIVIFGLPVLGLMAVTSGGSSPAPG